MKPYGLKKRVNVENPDIGDILEAGFKSSIGNLPGKGGDYRSCQHTKNKRRSRRIWKKLARRKNKNVCRYEIDQWNELYQQCQNEIDQWNELYQQWLAVYCATPIGHTTPVYLLIGGFGYEKSI